jgi:hypothetical protein
MLGPTIFFQSERKSLCPCFRLRDAEESSFQLRKRTSLVVVSGQIQAESKTEYVKQTMNF